MQSNLINQSQKMRITKLATKLQTEAYLIISKGKYVIISRPGLMLKKKEKDYSYTIVATGNYTKDGVEIVLNLL